MTSIKIIANPQAGRGRGRRIIKYVSRVLPERGLDFDLVETEYPGHAIELARQALASGYTTVIALGGDGTVNEVINGLCLDEDGHPYATTSVTLGVIPAGSGNDFAYAVGLPETAARALERLTIGETRLIDIGRINGRLFGYGVGIGLDAQINIESKKIKWLRGMLLYLIAIIKVILTRYKSYEMEIDIDGKELWQPTMMMSVANGSRTAGAFILTPDAKVDDGLLSLCIISPVSRLDMVRFAPLVLKGYHTKLGIVKTFDARQVRVKSESPLVAHVDGEVFGLGEKCFEFSLIPQGMRVIC